MKNIAVLIFLVATIGATGVAVAAEPHAAVTTSSGDELLASGRFAEAGAAFERVLQLRPNDVDANLGAAQVDVYRCDYAGAMHHARVAQATDAGNARAATLLALIARHVQAASTTYTIDVRAATATIPFLAIDPLPTLAVSIDGHEARVILDTGAPGLSVSADFAAKAGIRTTGSRLATFAGDRTAMVRTGGSVRSFDIGGVTVRDIPTDVAPMPDTSIDGVLGTGLLAHFVATIDYRRGRLVLRPWTDSERVQHAAASAGDTIVPMYLVADHFLFVDARVNEAPVALFNIDTGGPMIGIDLSRASLAAAGISPDAKHEMMLAGGGGAVRAQTFTASGVTIGTTTVHDVPGISVPESAAPQPFPFDVAGRLSHQFFRHTRVTLDFAAMKLVISTRDDESSL